MKQIYKKKTKFTLAMERYDVSKIQIYMDACPKYSESTLKKHKWAFTIYQGFCSVLGVEEWPMDGIVVSAFIRFIRLEVGYAIGSIEDVIIPSLKRMNKEETGKDLDADVQQYISEALREIKRAIHGGKHQVTKEPAILSDVVRIIESTPDGLPTKASEASLWLTSLFTGARAITCSSITLGDILSVIQHPKSPPGQSWVIIQLRFRVTKGNENWNQEISLEGRLDKQWTTNIVYWFSKHLERCFQLNLQDFRNWNLKMEQKSIKLWEWSRDSMRQLFKDRAIKAGFPEMMFGFHSLRSGFICSALIKARSDEKMVKAVLENTAFIAGWMPHHASQMRYVKTCVKKSIVCTRLILPDEQNLESNHVDSILTNSETFHNIVLCDSSWPDDTNYRSFVEKVDAYIFTKIANTSDHQKVKRRFWDQAVRDFVSKNEFLLLQAKEKLDLQTTTTTKRNSFSMETNAFHVVSRKYISTELQKDFATLEDFLNQFKASIDGKMLSCPLESLQTITKTQKIHPIQQNTRPTFQDSKHRIRIPWTQQEDDVLIQGKKNAESWVQISEKLYQNNRTNVDCKDRWRNLLKKTKKSS